MTLEKGQTLTLEEVAKFFHVTKRAVTRTTETKQKYLKEFAEYCDFVEKRGAHNRICFEIKEVYIAQAPEEKGIRAKNSKTYKRKALFSTKDDELRTYKSITTNIKDDKEIEAMNHKTSTQIKYIGEAMKEMFGREVHEGGTHGYIERKVWCTKHTDFQGRITYKPCTQEQIDYLFECFTTEEEEESKKERMEIIGDFYNDLYTKREIKDKLWEAEENKYLTRCRRFEYKYGYWPVHVPQYKITNESPE